ncbi:hypothetical protein P9B03_19075 [Metasolibacillus meyeri]|uniref:Uncharacterized protein n=1 Tax=Metasolibacillus meyeri TaxID=1071052 RepID=A0AAW9NW60_9BACL|nr:hypothetical protein [Metasolibacillus meyeri]MEC1180568.1 hypothetical protein [Metasolibacillus meyeri]
MKLDERLQQITRVEWDEKERLRQKERIMAKQKQPLFVPQFAMAAIACILLLLYLIEVKPAEQPQQQAQLTDELVKLTVLMTDKPERNLNLNSSSYVHKKMITDQRLLEQFQHIITAPTVVEQAWDGQLIYQGNLYQLLLTFRNDQQLYLKFANSSVPGTSSDIFELYDVYGQKKYVFTNGTDDGIELMMLLRQIYYETKPSASWKKYGWGLLLVFMVIDALFISKNRYNRDEDGNKKSLHWSWRILYTIIFTTSFAVSFFYLGTAHAGICIGGMIITIILQEYLEVKKGIKQANWLWAVMTIFYAVAVVALIMI